ncbi:hypothetical protein KMW28_00590 [Flammeovirga yaeyamensis]|uniref:Uncharacterized protein n=1 Tax=Flammeovirga yaeyamensis TaxID=367791 RepID=A0AAX1N3Q5_9BACT|nr:hypothetical protein [Flammeovirga yaeyamensis]MBB3700698.1 hypothetical protein [Flammeovirga yaeyamensis]NMF37810.1 hypothetical protein [Flammeovirga yaeyamensis]QWG02116.1 hypothetical protein KMW28_00590 [Flammeovirga yaeyamensis]
MGKTIANDNNGPTSKSKVSTSTTVKATTRYVFFKAVRKDCLEGDTEILSSIVEIDITKFSKEKFKLLADFQKEVQQKYPKNVIHVNLGSIEGVYTNLREATTAKKNIIDNVREVRSVVLK